MQNSELVRFCRAASESGLRWEIYESGVGPPEFQHTVPGVVVTAVKDYLPTDAKRCKAIGLLAAFAARRSLACWFEYCDSDRPLRTIQKVVSNVLSLSPLPGVAITEADLEPCRPSENGIPIIDCRASDAVSASYSVAQAAKYVTTRSDVAAALSIAAADDAYDVSPVGSVHGFERWFLDVALPGALEMRELTIEEQTAFADFPPAQLFGKRSDKKGS